MTGLTIEVLLNQCRSSDPAQQVKAVHTLLELEADAAVPDITELLESPDAVVRSTAVRALGILGTKDSNRVGAALLSLVDDTEAIVRAEVMDTLGLLRYAPAVDIVKSKLRHDPDPLVRAAAAETLGDLEDAAASTELELALHDPDESVRAYAASSLGLLGTAQLLPSLQTYLEAEPAPSVKAEFYGARCRLGVADDCDLLVEMLDHADEDLATNLLNILHDLTERKVPTALAALAPRLRGSLSEVARRMPILSGDVEHLLARLTKLAADKAL